MNDKYQQRKAIRKELSALSESCLKQNNTLLLKILYDFISQIDCDSGADILCWLPFFYAEPDLLPLQDMLNKKFYFPREHEHGQLRFYRTDCFSNDGPKGMLQPVADQSRQLKIVEGSKLICLVPGLAFDRNGSRLGRGAGMYDRFLLYLRSEAKPIVAGIGWSMQLVDSVISEQHDQLMDYFVCEKQVYKF